MLVLLWLNDPRRGSAGHAVVIILAILFIDCQHTSRVAIPSNHTKITLLALPEFTGSSSVCVWEWFHAHLVLAVSRHRPLRFAVLVSTRASM